MEIAVLLLVLFAIGMISFLIIKKLDISLEKQQNQESCSSENREHVIKIACENPIMLSSVSDAFEKGGKELKDLSVYYYTGSRPDIQKMLEDKRVDILLLLEDETMDKDKCYGKKVSSFLPAALSEPMTGLSIEPVEHQEMVMYVLWNECCITEKQRKLLFNI